MLRLIDFLSTPTKKLWPLLFPVAYLWSISLSSSLQFILLAGTKAVVPTNVATAFQGQASACWEKKTTAEKQGSRGQDRRWGKRRKQRGRACSLTHSGGPRQPPSSQYPTSRRPHSETHLMNTPALIQSHNGALHSHWARLQWRTSPQLNPRDNEQGREKGGGVCAEYVCERGVELGGQQGNEQAQCRRSHWRSDEVPLPLMYYLDQ